MIETVVLGVVLTIINVWDRHWVAKNMRQPQPFDWTSLNKFERKDELSSIRARAEKLRHPDTEPEPGIPPAHPIPEGL